MSVIPEVKCARCDRMYSGFRSRCPYCGARRIGSGKYSGESDNTKGKMIIGVLIMAVLVVAAGILLFATPKPVERDDPGPEASAPVTSPSLPSEEEVDSLPGLNLPTPKPPETTEEEKEEPSSSPPPKVQSVVITYSNVINTDFTASVGESVPLRAKIEPVGIELAEKIRWVSSNTSVFDVVPDNIEGTAATVTALGIGTATLTVFADDKEAQCIVRVNN